MENRVLLIVDPQYDFINGSLPVPNAEKVMNDLAQYILDNHDKYSEVVITADWHPLTHISFNTNGGEWPMHCIQHSAGAAIWQPILDALISTNMPYNVLTKGTNESREEYSIFKNSTSIHLYGVYYSMNEETVFDCCGLALDYCVLNTIKDGKRNLTRAKFNLLKDYTAAIGNPEDTYKELNELNVEII